MTDERSTAEVLADWNERLSTALGIPPAEVDAILELASVVAHSVVRPAAPLTAYLVGYAAGRAERDPTTLDAEGAFAVARGLAAPPS